MADYTAIATVSETMLEVLEGRLGTGSQDAAVTVTPGEVGLVSPLTADDDGVRLTLYLYRVGVNGHVTNRENQEVEIGVYRQPPLGLDLYYLLTVYPKTQNQRGITDQHKLLGRAMQVLREQSILADVLPGQEDVRLSVYEGTAEEVTDIWGTFPETPYQPSVVYLVSPVYVDPTDVESGPAVTERQVDSYQWHRGRDDGEANAEADDA